MEKKIKLSIIIPVFNVEKYVQTCLDSVIEQSFRDFEVIIRIQKANPFAPRNVQPRVSRRAQSPVLLVNHADASILLRRRVADCRAAVR